MECITLSRDLDWKKSASRQNSVKTVSLIYSGFMSYDVFRFARGVLNTATRYYQMALDTKEDVVTLKTMV